MVVDQQRGQLSDDEIDRVFRALADRTRRDIVRRTLAGEVTISHLAENYAMSFAAVQKHVAVLAGAGLVTKHPQGRERLVRANPATIRRTRQLLDRYEQLWRDRVDRLDSLLAATTHNPAAPPPKGSTMPVTSVTQDPEALTMTVVADFAVPLTRLWDAYADPRQLERFWGPPTYPAIFTRHDMFPGGRSLYCMTGPENDVSCGYWEYLAVTPMRSFEVLDGFAHPDGSANNELPSMRMVFTFAETTDGSRVTTTTYFHSLDELQQLIEMGMEEGMHAAMGQMDGVLADLATFASDAAAEAQLLSDTQVRVSRVIRGSVEQVWRAHHDADLMRRWLLGPDGWTMPVCHVATSVGDTYRYEWAQLDGTERFGFTGELLESSPPNRAVTTEQMIGMEGPGTTNEMTLTQVDGGTLLAIVITYPSVELRDMILATGMVDGMETSYARLEAEVLSAA